MPKITILAFLSIIFGFNEDYIPRLEVPEIDKYTDLIIQHKYYRLSYDDSHEQANWVAYKLYSKYLNKIVSRTNDFREDPKIRLGSSTLKDYKGSGYDRGHLLPAGDMVFNKRAMSETFFMSNISPQLPGFNRGIWKILEQQVRNWAVMYDTLHVVTGPILNDNLNSIGNDVSIPEYFYKVILDYNIPFYKGIAFLLPNESSSNDIKHYAVTIDSVEKLTGLDFFHKLDDTIEESIESNINLDKWSWIRGNIYFSNPQCIGLSPNGKVCNNKSILDTKYCSEHLGQGN